MSGSPLRVRAFESGHVGRHSLRAQAKPTAETRPVAFSIRPLFLQEATEETEARRLAFPEVRHPLSPGGCAGFSPFIEQISQIQHFLLRYGRYHVSGWAS